MADALIIGCGYLGRQVAACLRERGLSVSGTTRSEAKAKELAEAGIDPVLLDVVEAGHVKRLPEAALVFYCVGYDRAPAASMRAVYVEGLERVLERLAGWGSSSRRRLVYASSTGVYGQTDGSWVDEESETAPRTESGRICLEAEERLGRFSQEGGCETVVLRFSGLYGPGRLIRRAALERGEPIGGDPAHWLNLIEIRDAARLASEALMTSKRLEPLYVASDDRPVLRKQFYETMARVLGTTAPRFEEGVAMKPGRDATNKRVSNRRIKEGLGVALWYPDVGVGLAAALAAETGKGL